MQRAVQNLLSRVGRAPAFRPPQSRTFSGVPGKEQMNAAAARAGEEVQNLGNAIGENVQKLQWWTSAKVMRPMVSALRAIVHLLLPSPLGAVCYFRPLPRSVGWPRCSEQAGFGAAYPPTCPSLLSPVLISDHGSSDARRSFPAA